jgi:AcrR family transcriptional regulator
VLEKSEKPADPTRERIIDAALDLFGDQGLTGATVRDIAARAKVNVAAISYHFGGKEELYRAVAETVIGEIAGRVRSRVGKFLATPPADAESAVHALEELFTAFVDVIVGPEEMRRVARFVIREQMQPTSAFEVLFAMLSEFHGSATRLFAMAAGANPDADDTKLRAFMVFGQVLVFRIAEPAILRRLGRARYDAVLLDRIKADIRLSVRALVASARENKP